MAGLRSGFVAITKHLPGWNLFYRPSIVESRSAAIPRCYQQNGPAMSYHARTRARPSWGFLCGLAGSVRCDHKPLKARGPVIRERGRASQTRLRFRVANRAG